MTLMMWTRLGDMSLLAVWARTSPVRSFLINPSRSENRKFLRVLPIRSFCLDSKREVPKEPMRLSMTLERIEKASESLLRTRMEWLTSCKRAASTVSAFEKSNSIKGETSTEKQMGPFQAINSIGRRINLDQTKCVQLRKINFVDLGSLLGSGLLWMISKRTKG